MCEGVQEETSIRRITVYKIEKKKQEKEQQQQQQEQQMADVFGVASFLFHHLNSFVVICACMFPSKFLSFSHLILFYLPSSSFLFSLPS